MCNTSLIRTMTMIGSGSWGTWALPPFLIAMPTPQDDEQSETEEYKRNCGWLSCVIPRKHRASSASRYPDADARPMTTTHVPSTSVSRLLPVSPAQAVDVVQSNVGPAAVANYAGAGEYISFMDRPRLELVSKDPMPWFRLGLHRLALQPLQQIPVSCHWPQVP